MKSIDVKSLIIGFLSCALIIACAGASKAIYINPERDERGTYGIGCPGIAGCFILDTRSGKVIGQIQQGDVYDNINLIHSSVYDD